MKKILLLFSIYFIYGFLCSSDYDFSIYLHKTKVKGPFARKELVGYNQVRPEASGYANDGIGFTFELNKPLTKKSIFWTSELEYFVHKFDTKDIEEDQNQNEWIKSFKIEDSNYHFTQLKSGLKIKLPLNKDIKLSLDGKIGFALVKMSKENFSYERWDYSGYWQEVNINSENGFSFILTATPALNLEFFNRFILGWRYYNFGELDGTITQNVEINSVNSYEKYTTSRRWKQKISYTTLTIGYRF